MGFIAQQNGIYCSTIKSSIYHQSIGEFKLIAERHKIQFMSKNVRPNLY